MKAKTKTAGKTATMNPITMRIEGISLSLAEYMYLRDLLREERKRWNEFAHEDSIRGTEMIKVIDRILRKIEH